MIKSATEYVGQVIHYNDRDYTITEGPEYEHCAVATVTGARKRTALMLLKLDDNGDITRAALSSLALRPNGWQDVTVRAS